MHVLLTPIDLTKWTFQSCPNTPATRQHIEAHTTLVLETKCHVFQCHIVRLSPNFAKRCWAMQANIWTLCNAKVITNKCGPHALGYKGIKKESCSTNNVEYEFWFCDDYIKHRVSDNKNKYVLDWLVVPNMWPVKICTNLSREEIGHLGAPIEGATFTLS